MRKIVNMSLIILIAASLLCIAVYMPELDERYCEQQYVGRYVLVGQETQAEGIRYELTMKDKLAILTAMDMETFATEVFSTHSVNELEENDGVLIESLEKEISKLLNLRLMPDLTEKSLKDYFKEARYYNVCNRDNPYQLVSVWDLSFRDENRFQYRFLIDANTHKIYYMDIADKDNLIDAFLLRENEMDIDMAMEAYGYDLDAYWYYMENFVAVKGETIRLYYEADTAYFNGDYGESDFFIQLSYDSQEPDYQNILYMVSYMPAEKYSETLANLKLGIPVQIGIDKSLNTKSMVKGSAAYSK